MYINDRRTNTLTYLECKDHVKYLGVLIDYKLSWKNHIDSITLKLSKTIGLLSKIMAYHRRFPSILLLVYITALLFLIYDTAAGAPRRALRFLCFADRCDHAIPLFLHFLYYKLLAEAMRNVNNDVILHN